MNHVPFVFAQISASPGINWVMVVILGAVLSQLAVGVAAFVLVIPVWKQKIQTDFPAQIAAVAGKVDSLRANIDERFGLVEDRLELLKDKIGNLTTTIGQEAIRQEESSRRIGEIERRVFRSSP